MSRPQFTEEMCIFTCTDHTLIYRWTFVTATSPTHSLVYV